MSAPENFTNTNAHDHDGHRKNWQRLGNFVHDETPAGLIDGVNTLYTLARIPKSGTLVLVKNGLRLRPTVDYTTAINNATHVFEITMTAAPAGGDWLRADYRA
jgi:hypothetical protein